MSVLPGSFYGGSSVLAETPSKLWLVRIDPVLLQKILTAVEDDDGNVWMDVEIGGYEDKVVAAHIKHLVHAGHLEATEVTNLDSPYLEFRITGMTPKGRAHLEELKEGQNAPAEIKRYVDNAFLAKIMEINETRLKRRGDLYVSLAAKGHGRSSSACIIGEVAIEEQCIAELVHHKADLYLEVYGRNSLKIGPDVMRDLSETYANTVGVRKSTLMAEAQLTAVRTNGTSRAYFYAHLGKEASRAVKEVEAKIDLYNLTPKKVEPMAVTNNTYHLVNSRVTHGDDNSTNIVVNEQELFAKLVSVIENSVQNEAERAEILARLDDLKSQKTKTDYLAMMSKFIAAAASVGHVIAPYLPALIEKAEHLGR